MREATPPPGSSRRPAPRRFLCSVLRPSGSHVGSCRSFTGAAFAKREQRVNRPSMLRKQNKRPAKRRHGAARGSTLKSRVKRTKSCTTCGRESEGGRGLRPSRMTARLGTLANRLCCSSLIDRLWPHISPMLSPQKGELARVNGGLALRMSSGLPKGLGGSRGNKSCGCPRRGRLSLPCGLRCQAGAKTPSGAPGVTFGWDQERVLRTEM